LVAEKVRIEQQAGPVLDHRLVPVAPQAVAQRRRPPVLPDDGLVYGFSGLAVPQHRGLALIGNPDGGDILGRKSALGQGLLGDTDRIAPDVLGVVFDPAGLREMLRQLVLGRRRRLTVLIEDHGATAGRALVDGQDGACGTHDNSSPLRLRPCGSALAWPGMVDLPRAKIKPRSRRGRPLERGLMCVNAARASKH